MLASTIHISNTPPTNPTHQHTANRQRRRHRTNKPHPQEKPPRSVCGPDSSGPNSVPKPTTHPPHPQVPHPPPPPPKGNSSCG